MINSNYQEVLLNKNIPDACWKQSACKLLSIYFDWACRGGFHILPLLNDLKYRYIRTRMLLGSVVRRGTAWARVAEVSLLIPPMHNSSWSLFTFATTAPLAVPLLHVHSADGLHFPLSRFSFQLDEHGGLLAGILHSEDIAINMLLLVDNSPTRTRTIRVWYCIVLLCS
jgi:hypothetical protein